MPAIREERQKTPYRAIYSIVPWLRKTTPIWKDPCEVNEDEPLMLSMDQLKINILKLHLKTMEQYKEPVKLKCMQCKRPYDTKNTLPIMYRSCGHHMCIRAFFTQPTNINNRPICRVCGVLVDEIAIMLK